MICIGIDPGKSGGIVCLDEYGPPMACRLSETEADICEWLSSATDHKTCFAIIERVQPVPQVMRGVVASFKLGQGYGFLRGLLIALGIPFDEARPQAWQKAMGCLTHGDKNVSKAKAQQLYPDVKVTHWLADALLLAEFCRRTHEHFGV